MFDKKKLKEEWKRKGHTGNEIAELLGMTPQNLSNIIQHDNRGFSANQVALITNHIGTTFEMFVNREE